MRSLSVALLLGLAGTAAALGAAPVTTSCTTCHASADWFSGEDLAIVERFQDDVHARRGLGCQDCHGGNPAPTDDPAAAMDPSYRPNPYRGVAARADVPASCGRCHSDPVFMKRFRPDARVDQEREYWTSHHGRALRRGDDAVATCVDCHGSHGILEAHDPRAPVYPTRVAETCGACHADPRRMAGRRLPDGRPLPVDQLALWRRSVHAQALHEREDLTAPTCNDCHGNHGATPPGLDSIALVCGNCHGREADLFRASPKRQGFDAHQELLAEAGGEGCAACHAPPEPQAQVALHAFSECTTCHGNHAVVRPTIAMLSPLPATPCAFCHEGSGPLADEVPEPAAKALSYQTLRDALLAEASVQGIAEEERFDWLVDRAQELVTHTTEPASESGRRELRPEFARLFSKFRIGKRHFLYTDPVSDRPARGQVVGCQDCHDAGNADSRGGAVAADVLQRMREVIGLTARAERILLAARRGGVETRGALLSIDRAVDAEIELQVLVHTFAAGEGSAFAAKHADGVAHARAALDSGRAALRELGNRRRGLVVALAFVVLVLVGLALKIHELGRGGSDG